jgi:cell division protein FtsQ
VRKVDKGKIVSLEDRIPKLKQQRRKKANKRLVILLLFFFLLICCIIYFQSPLSHVKKIIITGNGQYSSAELKSNSGITTMTNIWKVDEEESVKKLLKLPELKSATIKIVYPNSVRIEVEEYKRIAYVSQNGHYSPVLDNGAILEDHSSRIFPDNVPILVGFKKGKVLNEMIEGLSNLPAGIVNSISEVQYTPKETDEYRITLYMNDGFQVIATLRNFSEKMSHYPSIISQLDMEKKGIIDLEVGSYFKAFEQEGAGEVENDGEG